jgi:hypothetical protein
MVALDHVSGHRSPAVLWLLSLFFPWSTQHDPAVAGGRGGGRRLSFRPPDKATGAAASARCGESRGRMAPTCTAGPIGRRGGALMLCRHVAVFLAYFLSLSLSLLERKKKQTTRLSRCADTFGRFFVHRHRVQYSRRRVCGIVCFCCKEGWESTWVLGVVCAARSATSSVVSLGLACTSAHASRYSLRKPRGSLGIGWSGVEVGFTGNSAMLCLWFLPCRERTQENDVCQMFPYIIPVIFMFVNYPWSQLPPRAPRGCSSLGVDQHHHHSPAEEQVPSFNMDDGSSSSHHALAISSSEMLVTGEEE